MPNTYKNDPGNYHPNDPEGNWNYDECPDINDYFERDGNLDDYDKAYDEWEESQYQD